MENLNQQQEQELSAEQLNEQKEKMLMFYTESLPYLKAQLEYENILLQIDESRFKRTNIQYNLAMMMNQQEELDEAVESDNQPQQKSPIQTKKQLKKE
jgi:hypothetical protein